MFDALLQKEKTIAVIGLGYVGLPIALAFARQFRVLGFDISADRVAMLQRGDDPSREMPADAFAQADITSFTGYDGRFHTVIDSTLFHSLPVDGRHNYLHAVQRAAAPGARYYVLVFAKGAFPAESESKPNEVDEYELRDIVAAHWTVDDIRPAFIHANMPSGPGAPFDMPPHDHDDKGRMKLPAFLLTAHK